MYILEQELTVLQQGKTTLDEFFDKVNERLNSIVNKINMTYKEEQTAKAFIDQANEKALRTFITGLNSRKGEVLYASKPKSLPEAYAMLQTILNDQERISYANRFNRSEERQTLRNPQFKPIQYQSRNFENHPINKAGNFQSYRENSQKIAEAMEVDRTSTAVNVERNQSNRNVDASYKRDLSKNNTRASFDQQKKVQRINNVADEAGYARTIVHDEHPEIDFDDEFDGTVNVDSDETSSIFLGN